MVLEKILIENGAPTLANLKTASLFTLPVEDDRETQQVLKKWDPWEKAFPPRTGRLPHSREI